MIKIINCSKKFKSRILFKNVNIDLPNTGCFLLNSPSGKGKSTLLKIIAGFDSNYDGSVKIDGDCIYLPQEDVSIKNLKFKDAIDLAPSNKSIDAKKYYLEKLKINHLLETNLENVSGGEYKRILLFFAIISVNQILLIDEPTASLDEISRKIYVSLIEEISKEKLIIIATHDNEYFNDIDGIISIEDRKISLELKKDKNDSIALKEIRPKDKNKDIKLIFKKLFTNLNFVVSLILLFVITLCTSLSLSIVSTPNSFYLNESLKNHTSMLYRAISIDDKGFYKNYSQKIKKEKNINAYYKFRASYFSEYFKDYDINGVYFSSFLEDDQIMINENNKNTFSGYELIINNKIANKDIVMSMNKMKDVFSYFNCEYLFYKDTNNENITLKIEFNDFENDNHNNIYISNLITAGNDEISFLNQVTDVVIPFENGIRSPSGEFEVLAKKSSIGEKIIISSSIRDDFIFYMYNSGIYFDTDHLDVLSKLIIDDNIFSEDEYYQEYTYYLKMISESRVILNTFTVFFVIVMVLGVMYYLYSFYHSYNVLTKFLLTIGYKKEKYKKTAALSHLMHLLVGLVISVGVAFVLNASDIIVDMMLFNIFDFRLLLTIIFALYLIIISTSIFSNKYNFNNFDNLNKKMKK